MGAIWPPSYNMAPSKWLTMEPYNEPAIACPECGHQHTHLIEVGKRPGTVWLDGLVLVFSGECGHWFKLYIDQHKGVSLVDCKILASEEAQVYEKLEEEMSMKHITEFYLEGDKTAIRTQAKTESEFIAGAAHLLVGFMNQLGDPPAEKVLRVNAWVEQCVDVCCKLRGYKSDVDEERVLIAGDRMLAGNPVLSVDENGTLVK